MDGINFDEYYQSIDAHFDDSVKPEILDNDLKLVLEDIQPYYEVDDLLDLEIIDNQSSAAIYLLTASILAAGGHKLIKIIGSKSSPNLTALWRLFVPNDMQQRRANSVLENCNVALISAAELVPTFYAEMFEQFREPLSASALHKLLVALLARARASGTKKLILSFSVGKTKKIKSLSHLHTFIQKFKRVAQKLGIVVTLDISESVELVGNSIGARWEAQDVLAVLEQSNTRAKALEKIAIRLAGMFLKNGTDEASRILTNGSAFKQFKEIIKSHGGNMNLIDTNSTRVYEQIIRSTKSGRIISVHVHNLGIIARILGAPESSSAGLVLLKRLNESVEIDEPLLIIRTEDSHLLIEAKDSLDNLPVYEITN